MHVGKELRLRRFFRKGRAVIVPMDHSLYHGPLGGLEDPSRLVEVISKTEVDGIIVSPGILDKVAGVAGDLAIILRIDGTHTKLGSHLERIDLITTVEHAVSVGADMVVVEAFCGADNEDELLQKLGFTATECFKWGLPLMGEMIPVSQLKDQFGKEKASGHNINEDIKLSVRVGAEAGADVIKTRYSGTIEGFKEVTATATAPVVIAGGPKAENDSDFLHMIKDCIEAGAAGICMGRNIWGRKNPKGMLEALCAIVHEDAEVKSVVGLL